MTDAAIFAQEWLRRTDELEQERRRAMNKCIEIEAQCNHCTSSLERSGKDPYLARAAQEDRLFDYADACERLRNITNQELAEDTATIDKLILLNNGLYAAILIDRYINRLSWQAIQKAYKGKVEKTTIYANHRRALDALGHIIGANMV